MPRLTPLALLLALPATHLCAAVSQDLHELGEAKDAPAFAAGIAEARKNLPAVEDSAVRALMADTLDKLEKKPGAWKDTLAAHNERLEEIVNKVPETLFLTRLSECKTPEETVRYARSAHLRVQHIKDPVLASIVRFTLAKLEDSPKDAPEILRDHLRKVGARFHESARQAFVANNAQACLEAVQIAIRCDPANTRARYLFAHLLQSAMGETDKAIRTLRVGLAHLAPADKETAGYLDRYFSLLESREADDEVIRETAALLGKEGFDKAAADTVAIHRANCLYWLGKYDECDALVAKRGLDSLVRGRILRARALFDARRTEAATALLDRAAADFSGPERDAVLSQQQRFFTDLGDNTAALSVADQRIRENPAKAAPRVHRLWIFDRQGDARLFEREVKKLLDEFGGDQSVLLGLAELAAERGRPGLALEGLNRALNADFNRPLFGLLAMEAHVSAREYAAAVELHRRLNSMDPAFFRETAPSANIILAAAKFGRADSVSRSEAERHVKSFLESPKLTPESYMAAARLLRRVGESRTALRILEKGFESAGWNNQLRADLATLRILTGETAAYGVRPPVENEIEEIAKGRVVNPRLWETVATWLDTEAKIPEEKVRALRRLVAARARPDLVKDNIRD